MNNNPSILVMLLAIALAAGAEAAEKGNGDGEKKKIYRSEDEQGNPVFSDRSSPDAAEVEVGEPMTMPSEALKAEYEAVFGGGEEESDEESGDGFTPYESLAITAPPNNQPIRANNGNVNVAFKVAPGVVAEHRIELLIDGTPVREVKGSGSVMLENMDRGTHQARLRVTHRESGEVLQQGPVQTFTVMRHSILNRRQ